MNQKYSSHKVDLKVNVVYIKPNETLPNIFENNYNSLLRLTKQVLKMMANIIRLLFLYLKAKLVSSVAI
jgi:hypothetical protein